MSQRELVKQKSKTQRLYEKVTIGGKTNELSLEESNYFATWYTKVIFSVFILIMLFNSISKMLQFGKTQYVDSDLSKPLNYTLLKDKRFPGGVDILKFD